MTPDEAINAVHVIFDEVQNLVGGEWHSDDDSPPRACSLANGSPGVSRSVFQYAQGSFDDKAVFAKVKEAWTEAGYALSEREDTGEASMLRLFAEKPDGQSLQFTAASNSMTLEGVSACAPEGGN